MTNDSVRAETLITDIRRLAVARCPCSASLCGHALLFSFLLGFKDQPRCPACLSKALGRPDISPQLIDTVLHRACYRAAWEWTTREERACPVAAIPAAAAPAYVAHRPVDVQAEADFGDMGCGDLALELRLKLRSMAPGEVIQVIARDPGAPEDIPSWCRLTGNPLVYHSHPVYLIQRGKEA